MKEVIEKGDISYWDVFSSFNPPYQLFIASLLLYVVVLLILMIIDLCITKIEFMDGFDTLSIIVLIFFAFSSLTIIYQTETLITKWEEEEAYPFISQLEERKEEVVFAEFDADTSLSVVSYTQEGVVKTIEEEMEIIISLPKGDKPYLAFNELEEDLGNGIEKGLYNVKLHLPEDYDFHRR